MALHMSHGCLSCALHNLTDRGRNAWSGPNHKEPCSSSSAAKAYAGGRSRRSARTVWRRRKKCSPRGDRFRLQSWRVADVHVRTAAACPIARACGCAARLYADGRQLRSRCRLVDVGEQAWIRAASPSNSSHQTIRKTVSTGFSVRMLRVIRVKRFPSARWWRRQFWTSGLTVRACMCRGSQPAAPWPRSCLRLIPKSLPPAR